MQRRLLHGLARHASSPIFHLSPMVRHFSASYEPDLVVPESEWHSPRACIQMAKQANAAAVWLGGTEPLFHPAIGEVAGALAEAGYYVFVHTSGVGLRKRIHEFKPVDRLYFALEVPDSDALAAQSRAPIAQAVPFPAVLEAIRVASLCGFHICAHFTVTTAASAAVVASHWRTLESQHLDGIVASSGVSLAGRLSVAGRLGEVLKLVPSQGWRAFSRLLDASYPEARPSTVPAFEVRSDSDQPGTQSACEETA